MKVYEPMGLAIVRTYEASLDYSPSLVYTRRLELM